MLAGAVSVYVDSAVRVLIITHSVAEDDRDWVSIAFRRPRYGLISNASTWYLFYKVYHEGYIVDTDVGRALQKVRQLLAQFEDNLTIEPIQGLTGEDLLQYCELPAFRAMRDLSRKAAEVNKDLRSGFSELMAAFWMQSSGYGCVRASFRRASLDNLECDAIGIRDNKCLVVEVKTGEVMDSELQDEINEFAQKVEFLRGRLPEVAQTLGYGGRVDNISGTFISLTDLAGFEPVEHSVELWDYDRFVRELTKVGLSKRLVDFMKKEHIIRHLPSDLLAWPDSDLA